jgi:hypothetical protein
MKGILEGVPCRRRGETDARVRGVSEPTETPRGTDEWRVEVALDEEQQGQSLGEKLHSLELDDEARERLGGSVIVTRDGDFLFLYAWHEESALEAERAVRRLMEHDKLSGEVTLTRWHPVAEEWRPADEPLPDTEVERAEEENRHEEAAQREVRATGEYPWEVVIDLPDRPSTLELAKKLRREGLPLKRRWKYLLIGADTEDSAVELGKRLESEVPDGSHVGVRGNPEGMPAPGFIMLGSMKPGFLRDLGI